MKTVTVTESQPALKSYSTRPGPTERIRVQTVMNNFVLHLHPARIPAGALRFSYTWGLGGISALLSVMLVATGVLLMFRYEASVERAYSSIQTLETEVMFGSLVRAIHHWAANLLLVVAGLHMVRVFLTGSYKQGRAANWIIGLGVLLLLLASNFTGYLLPWDQLAYWAITVSTSLIGYLPAVGPAISGFLLAGPEVGQVALQNFYAIHVSVLPILLTATVAYHFWKIRKNGGISQPAGRQFQRLTTIPHLVRRELAVAAVVFTGLIVWAMAVPAPLQELANPQHAPNPAKAAWYFVGFQELLLHMQAPAAMLLVTIIGGALLLLPAWDRDESDIGIYFRSTAGLQSAIVGVLLGTYLVPLLVILDEFFVDLPMLLPGLPDNILTGWLPLALILGGLAAIYFGLRRLLKANHSQALVGLFSLLAAALVMLTVIGVFFRGENMALVLPF